MESYGCHRIWLWGSRAMRICDTIMWLPTMIIMLLATTADLILTRIMDIQQLYFYHLLASISHPVMLQPLNN
jgi:hypothetical protein